MGAPLDSSSRRTRASAAVRVHLAGTDEQKQTYLVPMAQGKVLGAYGLTEPGAGSDAGGTRTTATLEDPRRTGSRDLVPGGIQAVHHQRRAGRDLYRDGTHRGDANRRCRDQRLHRPGTPGFSVGRLEDKLGLHASATGELRFERAGVPAANLLGKRGDGFKTFLKILDGGRISIGALAGAWPRRRSTRRSRMRRHASSSAGRSDRSRGSRSWSPTWRPRSSGGRRLEGGVAEGPGARLRARRSGGKLFASEVSARATNAAIQIHGGYGYVTDYPVERFMRDAKLTEIGEGTSRSSAWSSPDTCSGYGSADRPPLVHLEQADDEAVLTRAPTHVWSVRLGRDWAA